MVAMRTRVGDCDGGILRDLLLYLKVPGEDGRRCDIRLNVGGRDEASGASLRRGGDVQARDRHVGLRQRGVERCRLVETVVEVVEQRVMQAEARADRGPAVAERVPREADARLRQELRTVDSETG